MNTPITLGIDPGKTGALAALDHATGSLIWVEDMPDPLSGAALADLLQNEIVAAAVVEAQAGRPGQSSSSMFKFGVGYGIILGTLSTLRIGYALAPAATWKRAMELNAPTPKERKNLSRQRATEIWPGHSASFRRVKDDGRAEAALLAKYHRDSL
jgi:crossover junction endodeoxyribonuclease RuvC